MGTEGLGNGYVDENGAVGAYWPDTKQTLARAIQDVQQNLKRSGRYYRSVKTLNSDWMNTRLRLERRFMHYTGKKLLESKHKWTDDEIKELWEKIPKGHYKILAADRWTITERPLLGIKEGAGTIYAWTEQLQTYPSRLIKIGHTEKLISDYIRPLVDHRNPKLLATRPGTESEERAMHRKWKSILAARREYFHPTPELAEWILETFDVIESCFWERWGECELCNNC